MKTPLQADVISRGLSLLLALGFACTLSLRSQILPVQNYTTENGLSSDEVTSIVQDSYGYL